MKWYLVCYQCLLISRIGFSTLKFKFNREGLKLVAAKVAEQWKVEAKDIIFTSVSEMTGEE